MDLLQQLQEFIRIAHAGQTDGGPQEDYWKHPCAVQNALPPFASDDLKAAALLHDVVEDTAFKPEGNRLVFCPEKFQKLSQSMQTGKRRVEVEMAAERGEVDPDKTPPVLASPELSERTLAMVKAVTNDGYSPPEGLDKEAEGKAFLDWYQGHILELASHRPEDPEERKLADEIVLLKFTDMSQNVGKERMGNITDPKRVTWFANKYEVPFEALLVRAKQIALEHGYRLVAATELQDDGQGNKRYCLTSAPQWIGIERGRNNEKGI